MALDEHEYALRRGLEEPSVREFNFSEGFLKARNRDILIASPFLALTTLSSILLFTGAGLKETLTAWSIALLVVAAIFAIEWPLVSRILRNMKVLVLEDKITKRSGKTQELAFWAHIKRIRRVENTKGEVVSITLYQESKKPIHIFGFDGMETIDLLVQERAPRNTPIQRSRQRPDWETRTVALLIGMGTAVIMALVASRGYQTFDIFTRLVAFVAGAGLLVFSPLTQGTLRVRWFEILLGVLLLILASGVSITLSLVRIVHWLAKWSSKWGL